jgi:hypothetical protein
MSIRELIVMLTAGAVFLLMLYLLWEGSVIYDYTEEPVLASSCDLLRDWLLDEESQSCKRFWW